MAWRWDFSRLPGWVMGSHLEDVHVSNGSCLIFVSFMSREQHICANMVVDSFAGFDFKNFVHVKALFGFLSDNESKKTDALRQ